MRTGVSTQSQIGIVLPHPGSDDIVIILLETLQPEGVRIIREAARGLPGRV